MRWRAFAGRHCGAALERGRFWHQTSEHGQAMLIVIGLVSVMVAVPVAINVMAVGQTTTSQEAAVVIQAKQAAAAGVSDYINHLQAYNLANPGSSYIQYCSSLGSSFGLFCFDETRQSGIRFFGHGIGRLVHQRSDHAGHRERRGLLSVCGQRSGCECPAHITVFSIGQAGTQHGQHATYTDEAALTVCAGGCISPVTTASCVKVPTGAQYAHDCRLRRERWGLGSSRYSYSIRTPWGLGALVNLTLPVTASHILELIPGQPGVPGDGLPYLVDLINPVSGRRRPGGRQAGYLLSTSPQPPPDLSGGNGAHARRSRRRSSTDGGGGGGGASMVFDDHGRPRPC